MRIGIQDGDALSSHHPHVTEFISSHCKHTVIGQWLQYRLQSMSSDHSACEWSDTDTGQSSSQPFWPSSRKNRIAEALGHIADGSGRWSV